MENKFKILTNAIGAFSILALTNLVASCWFSPEMRFPLYAIKALWLPNLSFIIIFLVTIISVFMRRSTCERTIIHFTPLLLINGILASVSLKIIFDHSYSFYIFQHCLFGFFQIILAILIILLWKLKTDANPSAKQQLRKYKLDGP